MPNTSVEEALAQFAVSLTANFRSNIPAQPEDQLKAPMVALLTSAGSALEFAVGARTEAQVAGLGGRPDMGVEVNRLLTGYVELKAPGLGARPQNFRGENAKQWAKFQTLPNLIYTDGTEWTLFRSGTQQATLRLSGDVTQAGAAAVSAADAESFGRMLRDFFLWQPIVPASAQALAELLAPLCRLVRDDVAVAVQDPDSNISQLAREWRQTLFPDADDARFADAYAQTLTYALLLARFSGQEDVKPVLAAEALDSGHGLLAQALRILSQREAQKEIGIGLDLLVRLISAVRPETLQQEGNDPWLYFYEHFLAAYDRKLRNDYGVYYTPAEVIQAQVRLVSKLLQGPFQEQLSFAGSDVVVLDPAAGTGAYPLAVLQHGLDHAAEQQGAGSVSGHASEMARNLHAFEFMVGPYAVAHLRLTQKIQEAGGALPPDGIHVYLTDTLEAPHAPPQGQLALMLKALSEEHQRAQVVKSQTRVLVCLGNPPYDRQEIGPDEVGVERRGGWVRFGDDGKGGILDDFIRPVREAGRGGDVKNLYNDYVYFWRWVLWKVFETTKDRGIVSLITAGSYLRGPGFSGMRQVMRQTFDELWIIDLEGGSLGARKTQNVFNIQTPVAIALGVRYGTPQPTVPARVHYTRVTGTRAEKLAKLHAVSDFADLEWKDGYSGWQEPFLPKGVGNYYEWPLITDIFPWQHTGSQFKRAWPIGETKEVLEKRWSQLMSVGTEQRVKLFGETRDRKIHRQYGSLQASQSRPPALNSLPANAVTPRLARYGYRSFDRQWALADMRVGDFLKPVFWRTHGANQIYMTSLLTDVLGIGPAVTVSAEVPDLHYFSGRGGKDVIPLWRNAAATEPNVTGGLLDRLAETYGNPVGPEDLFAYVYALLASPRYVEQFSEELVEPGPRLPLTRDATLFQRTAALGRQLIYLHSYAERMTPPGAVPGRVPQGQARNTVAVPTTAEGYPTAFSYDELTQTLTVGTGRFAPVTPAVWGFSVSGLEVVRSWLAYRMRARAGRASSDLDKIRPEAWTAELNTELLHLLWVLEQTVALWPTLSEQFGAVVSGPLFLRGDLPQPTPIQRRPPLGEAEDAEQEPLALGED